MKISNVYIVPDYLEEKIDSVVAALNISWGYVYPNKEELPNTLAHRDVDDVKALNSLTIRSMAHDTIRLDADTPKIVDYYYSDNNFLSAEFKIIITDRGDLVVIATEGFTNKVLLGSTEEKKNFIDRIFKQGHELPFLWYDLFWKQGKGKS